MDWLTLVLTNLVTLVVGTGGTILYFRPKLKEANASADMKQTEAENFMYDSLINRINTMEKMYNEQLSSQNKVISELRSEILVLGKEKFNNEKRIGQLEQENAMLKDRVNELEKEISMRSFVAPGNI